MTSEMTIGASTAFRLETKDEFWVVGVGGHGPHRTGREWVMKLWDQLQKRAGELPHSLDRTRFFSPCHGRETEFTCYIGFESPVEVKGLPTGMVCIRIPRHTYAIGAVRGSRDEINQTYSALPAWAKAQGIETIKEILWLETYPQPPSHEYDAPLDFDIYLPVRGDGIVVERPLGLITHVQLPVRDLDRATAWYREHLGFDVYRRSNDDHAILKLRSGATLFLWRTGDQTTANFTRNGEVMPAIGISCADVHRLREQLVAAGATITFFADEGFGWVMKFLDPDGNMLVVHQDHPT